MTGVATVHSKQPSPDDPGGLAPLLRAASRGDEGAWRELVARYSRRLFGMAKSRCGSVQVAEEIVQSVFVTLATKLRDGAYVEQGKFESWLFRVAMNRVRDEARRGRRRPAATGEDERIDASGARDTPAQGREEDFAALRRAMDQLPESDREVLELRHHGGMSFADIAEMTHEPVGTLLSRHHRALRKLRDLMDQKPASSGQGGNGE